MDNSYYTAILYTDEDRVAQTDFNCLFICLASNRYDKAACIKIEILFGILVCFDLLMNSFYRFFNTISLHHTISL